MTLIVFAGGLAEKSNEIRVEWNITDFFSLPTCNCSCFRSPSFHFANSSWYLRIFLDGDVDNGSMSLYVVCEENPEPPKEVSLLVGIKKWNGRLEELYSEIHNFTTVHYEHACNAIIRRRELAWSQDELVPDDVLTIACVMKYENANADQRTQKAPIRGLYLESLSKNFQDLYKDKGSCDTTLRVMDKEFQAHSAVLTARSSVFSEMLEHHIQEEEQTNFIYIPDCDPDSFEDFLRYLYTGKIEGISPGKVLYLYVTSAKFDVQELRTWCVEALTQNVSLENMLDIIYLGDTYDEPMLMSVGQDFFNKHMDQFFSTNQWHTLVESNFPLAQKLLMGMASKFKGYN